MQYIISHKLTFLSDTNIWVCICGRWFTNVASEIRTFNKWPPVTSRTCLNITYYSITLVGNDTLTKSVIFLLLISIGGSERNPTFNLRASIAI